MFTKFAIFSIILFNLTGSSTSTAACGIMSSSAGLIQGGQFSAITQFPWIAIISGADQHHGSGSLISSKHVLAHPLSVSAIEDQHYYSIPTKWIKVFLGTKKYDDLTQPGSLSIDVLKITNHPEARRVLSKFDIFKVSIITLVREVSFNEFIQPVCLWPYDDEIVGRDAYAVGYGVDHTDEDSLMRKHVKVTVIKQEYCEGFFKEEFAKSNGSKHFCVLSSSYEGPCNGDSQLYVKVSDAWYLMGVKNIIYQRYGERCKTLEPVLFEDIAPLVPWITSQMT